MSNNRKRRREKLAITRAELATFIGISERTLKRWEEGETTPVSVYLARRWEAELTRLERRARA